MLPAPMHKPIADFLAAFAAAHAKPEPGSSPFVWDAANVILSGLRKLGPTASATSCATTSWVKTYTGVEGTYDFSRGDQHGLSDQSVVMALVNPKTQDFYAVSGLGGIPLKNAAGRGRCDHPSRFTQRFPLVKRDDLDDFGKKIYDEAVNDKRSLVGLQGPGGIRLHSPELTAKTKGSSNYLRFEAGLGPAAL